MSFNQRIHVIIDLKEQIWLPNENICDCHLTHNRHYYCVWIHMCIKLKFISVNKEKNVCQTRNTKLTQVRKYKYGCQI